MPDKQFDLIIVGAGPGGYVAAIRAAQLGMSVVVVEKREAMGGVCLNEGCIPSKAMLDSSELFAIARDKFALHGIGIDSPSLDLGLMMRRKDDVVKKLTDGIAYLFKKNGIKLVQGTARLMGRNAAGLHEVQVLSPDPAVVSVTLLAAKVLLATGSEAIALPGIPFDGQVVVDSRVALSFERVPEHLIVVGGGFIGLELGSVWRRLGAQVTVMESLPQILPAMDRQIADVLYRSLKKQGIRFNLGVSVEGLRQQDSKAFVRFSSEQESLEVDCDRMLVAVGRRPLTAGLGLDELGIGFDDKGRIEVDASYQTALPGLYAIGDLVPGPMLAHKASQEGVVCVEQMAGQSSVVEYEFIPGVVYTWPEAACVGKTEERLRESATPFRSGRFNFSASGRARCMDEADGFIKILAHQETDRILGVHIVGPRASDLIAEAVTVMSFGGTARDIALTFHAHPTLSEAIKEAALDVHKEAIHA